MLQSAMAALSLVSSLLSRQTSLPSLSSCLAFSSTAALERSCKSKRTPHPVPEKVGVNPYMGKKLQEWWDWDGLGPYKYRHHHYPNNITCRWVGPQFHSY